MQPELQECFDLVDNVCSQVQMNRANHLLITQALQQIKDRLEATTDNHLNWDEYVAQNPST